mmetsp:Transcript_21004/g.63158  ORF Transcript_21004/g.63158 Transcript_21004/m.63158 type:complete len:241 (-) Transcript_21004:712-1434(-)
MPTTCGVAPPTPFILREERSESKENLVCLASAAPFGSVTLRGTRPASAAILVRLAFAASSLRRHSWLCRWASSTCASPSGSSCSRPSKSISKSCCSIAKPPRTLLMRRSKRDQCLCRAWTIASASLLERRPPSRASATIASILCSARMLPSHTAFSSRATWSRNASSQVQACMALKRSVRDCRMQRASSGKSALPPLPTNRRSSCSAWKCARTKAQWRMNLRMRILVSAHAWQPLSATTT